MTQLNLETAVPIGSLSADMTAVATSAVLQSGEGATMPDVPFVIGINEEAMVCTVVSTDTLTVTREFGDTTATTHSTDDEVSHIFTAEFFGLLPDDAGGSFYAQGDISMDGNALVGHSLSLAGLSDTDLTGIADGDSLVFSEGVYAALSRAAWTATASGYYNASTMPSNVIDGLPATLWHSSANSTGRWIQIDAGSAVSASRLVFTTDNYGGYNATLQRSDNGSSWTTVVASFAISSYTTHTENFAEATARYWRVTTLGSGYFTCTEFDLWVADSVWEAASSALESDGSGGFDAQGDINLDGNELIGHSETLAGLDDVDLTGIADGDHLAVTTGTYSLETTVPTPTAVPSSGTPANAIDGNTSTYWTALCSSGVMGINFDFGKSVTLSRIRIRYGVSYGAPFAIRKSTDGSTWIDVATYDNTHAVNSYVNHDFTETESRYWRLEERYGSGSYWRLYEVDFWSQQNTWYVESPAFVDNAGTFEAQGDIDLDGNDLLGGALESDGSGGFDAQGDINLNGNDLIGYSGVVSGNTAAKMYMSSDQSISANTDTELAWQVEDYDTDGDVVDLTDNSFVIPVDGVYDFKVFVNWSTGTPDESRMWLTINGSYGTAGLMQRQNPVGDDYQGLIGFGSAQLSAGDIVTFTIWFEEAVTLRGATASVECWASMNRVDGASGPGSVVAARAVLTSAQTILNTTWTTPDWDETEFDTAGMWDSGDPERLTAPHYGIYHFTANWNHNYTSSTVKDMITRVWVYDSTDTVKDIVAPHTRSSGAYNGGLSTGVTLELDEGDYVYVEFYQNTGGTRSMQEAYSSMSLFRVGGGDYTWGDWIDVDSGVGYENSWVSNSAGQAAEYRKHSDGMVQVRGVIKSGTLTSTAFTLPSGYRPYMDTYTASVANSVANAYSTVQTGGAVVPQVGSNVWFVIDAEFDSTGGS